MRKEGPIMMKQNNLQVRLFILDVIRVSLRKKLQAFHLNEPFFRLIKFCSQITILCQFCALFDVFLNITKDLIPR